MLMVQETYVDKTKGYRFSESEWYEAYTDSRRKLFRNCQQEYGKCVSKVYVDTQEGTKQVGWVFEKKMVYEDCRNRPTEDDKYIREVWVSVREIEGEEDNEY